MASAAAGREVERAAHATREFLVASRRDGLSALRASALGSALSGVEAQQRRSVDGELLRAEYEEMRAMHILFVQASNRRVSELQDVVGLRQVEADALREDLTGEKQRNARQAAELSEARQQLAERTLERDRAVSSLEPFLEARDLIVATSGGPAPPERRRQGSVTNHEDLCESAESMLLGRVSKDSHSRVLERAAAREQLQQLRASQADWARSHSVAMLAQIQAAQIACANTLGSVRRRTRVRGALRGMQSYAIRKATVRGVTRILARSVYSRLLARGFSTLKDHGEVGNVVRRRGCLVGMRHRRALLASCLAAWRWYGFAIHWLPPDSATLTPPDSGRPSPGPGRAPHAPRGGERLASASWELRRRVMAATQDPGQGGVGAAADSLQAFAAEGGRKERRLAASRLGNVGSSPPGARSKEPGREERRESVEGSESESLVRARENRAKMEGWTPSHAELLRKLLPPAAVAQPSPAKPKLHSALQSRAPSVTVPTMSFAPQDSLSAPHATAPHALSGTTSHALSGTAPHSLSAPRGADPHPASSRANLSSSNMHDASAILSSSFSSMEEVLSEIEKDVTTGSVWAESPIGPGGGGRVDARAPPSSASRSRWGAISQVAQGERAGGVQTARAPTRAAERRQPAQGRRQGQGWEVSPASPRSPRSLPSLDRDPSDEAEVSRGGGALTRLDARNPSSLHPPVRGAVAAVGGGGDGGFAAGLRGRDGSRVLGGAGRAMSESDSDLSDLDGLL